MVSCICNTSSRTIHKTVEYWAQHLFICGSNFEYHASAPIICAGDSCVHSLKYPTPPIGLKSGRVKSGDRAGHGIACACFSPLTITVYIPSIVCHWRRLLRFHDIISYSMCMFCSFYPHNRVKNALWNMSLGSAQPICCFIRPYLYFFSVSFRSPSFISKGDCRWVCYRNRCPHPLGQQANEISV